MSYLMDYRPDWPPAPKHAERVTGQATSRRRFAFWFRTLLIAALLFLASFAIVDSRVEPDSGEQSIQFVDPAPHFTTTLPPSPHVAK